MACLSAPARGRGPGPGRVPAGQVPPAVLTTPLAGKTVAMQNGAEGPSFCGGLLGCPHRTCRACKHDCRPFRVRPVLRHPDPSLPAQVHLCQPSTLSCPVQACGAMPSWVGLATSSPVRQLRSSTRCCLTSWQAAAVPVGREGQRQQRQERWQRPMVELAWSPDQDSARPIASTHTGVAGCHARPDSLLNGKLQGYHVFSIRQVAHRLPMLFSCFSFTLDEMSL